MKIQILSDLHIEFRPFTPPDTGADVIILAGDIHVGAEGVKWALKLAEKTPVIYVLGNHEYYHHTMPQLCGALKTMGKENDVHVLDNESVVINGVRFVGSTLWTDFMLDFTPAEAQIAAMQCMPDYRLITIAPGNRTLKPEDTVAAHRAAKRWLTAELPKSKEPTVVVTHHAPSNLSIAERFRGENFLNAAFASNMDGVVAESGARYWVHGHTHARLDYTLGSTRVLCNPRGYPKEETGFDPAFTVEV